MSDDHKSTFSGPRGKDRLVEWYGAVVLQSGRCASQPLLSHSARIYIPDQRATFAWTCNTVRDIIIDGVLDGDSN